MNSPLMRQYLSNPSPLTCWSTKKKVGMKNSPSGLKDPDGTPKQVNDCVPK